MEKKMVDEGWIESSTLICVPENVLFFPTLVEKKHIFGEKTMALIHLFLSVPFHGHDKLPTKTIPYHTNDHDLL